MIMNDAAKTETSGASLCEERCSVPGFTRRECEVDVDGDGEKCPSP